MPITRAYLALLLTCLCAMASSPAAAGEKWALLIGIDSLRATQAGINPLKFAGADVAALQQELEKQGYRVTALRDSGAKREDVFGELVRFAAIVKPEDTFLLYYAGHGVRNKAINHKTYWLTYDATLDRLDVAGVRLPHLLDYV